MDKKSNSKESTIKINYFKNDLFVKLSDQELKKIKGGSVLKGDTSAFQFAQVGDFDFDLSAI